LSSGTGAGLPSFDGKLVAALLFALSAATGDRLLRASSGCCGVLIMRDYPTGRASIRTVSSSRR